MSVTNPGFNPSGNFLVSEIKDKVIELEALILKITPCRRRSIALTHLETASMYAVKAVVDPD